MTHPVHPDTREDAGEVSVLGWLQDIADNNAPSVASPAMIPVAWIGRTSTEDKQDPTLSLPRQLEKARVALPPPFVIVAHFYDVESGRTELGLRGQGTAHEQFDIPIPRDGGIADALNEAKQPTRRFVAVVCESVERIARVTYFGTKIEYELEQGGVALLAADEGIDPDAVQRTSGRGPKKATSILTRRVKQAIAEWYVLQMLELSWDGFKVHTHQGWNIGKPPYGYLAEHHPHPVKAKREEGATKTRLVCDPPRGAVVTQIFTWRALERLSFAHIADRLNVDLDKYPPPEPIRRLTYHTAVGAWTPTSVRDVLNNPKYTGYMVWNRRKRSRPERGVAGRVNPPNEWVWSPQPTHEPLVTRRLFDTASPIGQLRRGSRSTPGANTAHPHTKRSYLLRSYLLCDLCGRRMFGKTRHKKDHDLTYYACTTNREHHQSEPWYPHHPANILVNEEQILPIITKFFNQRIFGHHRKIYLNDHETHTDRRGTDAQQAATRQQIAKLQQAETNLWHQLDAFTPTGDDDLDTQWRTQLQQRFVHIASQRRTKTELLGTQTTQAATVTNIDLIDQLPALDLDLRRLPEEHQRRLYDAFQLELRYNRHLHKLTLRATLRSETIETLQHAVRAIAVTTHGRNDQADHTTQEADPRTPVPHTVSHVRRAPGLTRTAPGAGCRGGGRTPPAPGHPR